MRNTFILSIYISPCRKIYCCCMSIGSFALVQCQRCCAIHQRRRDGRGKERVVRARVNRVHFLAFERDNVIHHSMHHMSVDALLSVAIFLLLLLLLCVLYIAHGMLHVYKQHSTQYFPMCDWPYAQHLRQLHPSRAERAT